MKKSTLFILFLCFQQAVFAQFIYTDVVPDSSYFNPNIYPSEFVIDLNNDDIYDIVFQFEIGPDDYMALSSHLLNNAEILEKNNELDSLSYNDSIKISDNWSPYGQLDLPVDYDYFTHEYYCYDLDTWCQMENKYFGIRLNLEGEYYYGWILMKNVHTIAEYAINTIPNDEIFAGEGKPPFAENIIISDVSNMQDGRDLHVNFNHALNEQLISEYRLIVVKSEDSETFDIEQANNIAPENYTIIDTVGTSFNSILSQTTTDKDGDLIQDLVEYNVFVLSIADGENLFENTLSYPSNKLTLMSPPPTVENLSVEAEYLFDANYNINISFDNLADESQIGEYRIMFVEEIQEENITMEVVNEIISDNYFVVNTQGNPYNLSYPHNSITDIYGNELDILKYYKAIVVCTPNGNETDVNSFVFTEQNFNIRTIAEQVKNIRIIDNTDFGDASDFVISFPKIESENTISEYRLFIMDYQEEFSMADAENTESNFYSITPNGNDCNMNFPNNIIDINGNNLTENATYKAHILSITDNYFSDFNSFSERSNYFSFNNPAFIYCGQTEGLTYVDIVPDTILNPSYNTVDVYKFDINNDEIDDFRVWAGYGDADQGNSYMETGINGIGSMVAGYSQYWMSSKNFEILDVVSSSYFYSDAVDFSFWYGENPVFEQEKDSFFVALKKVSNDEITYGWVNLSVEDYKKVTIYGYAYKGDFINKIENEHLQNDFNLQVYPNPVSSNCNLKISGTESTDYVCKLYDLQGKLYLQKEISSPYQNILFTLDFQNIPQGVYILHLSNSKSTTYQKIIKL